MALTSAKIWRPKWYRRTGWSLAAFGVLAGFALTTAATDRSWLTAVVASSLPRSRAVDVARPGTSSDQVSKTSVAFFKCSSTSSSNCVIDGDTFWYQSEKIRIADIDAPETGGARCYGEAQLGARATDRLAELLSRGAFELRPYASRDRDQYGRLLRVVKRNGASIGQMLVTEGLARRWEGRRRPWC
ncbi:thermonuclease family protein [Bosea sp. AAP35]|uniref:thermonuclease family protein n=1 Tax=Bosea sp. AAP35 TaxID=1523417 RepID=UPI0009EB125E|nr:thermonuclease family protein [Bosea sp. AAP35]